MKSFSILFIVIFSLLIISCSSSNNTKNDTNAVADNEQSDTAAQQDTQQVQDTQNKDDTFTDTATDAAVEDTTEIPDETVDEQTDELPDETAEDSDKIKQIVDMDIEYPDIDMNPVASYDGTYGWEILKSSYTIDASWDALSFEWDYFMIHNEDDSFSGSVGYLIANPRNKTIAGGVLGKLVPGGGNIAIAGQFDKALPPIADYENFDPANGQSFTASGTERSMAVENTSKGYWAKMTPDKVNDTIHLEGKTGNFEWDLTVRQDWSMLTTGADTFVKVTDDKVDTAVMSIPAAQVWNVHMFWPRTKITGSIKDLRTNTNYPIDAHGYRENSWGRWAFNQGGWDFGTVSDKKSNVMFGWQTYHFKSTRLDYLDLGFMDNGQYKLVNFRSDKNELGWRHDKWSYDIGARQCVPRNSIVIAKNANYKVEAHITIDNGQIAMLSDATSTVKNYVIMIQIPWFDGFITRLSDNKIIATFSGRGGGEFSNARAKEGTTNISDADCQTFGQQFQSPMPPN